MAGLIQRETGIAAMVAKFPMSDVARTYIDTEAETLDRLQREIPGAAPRTDLPAMWVHGDLHAGNIILRKQGVVQAMDWAFALPDRNPLYLRSRPGTPFLFPISPYRP